jgi:hypothetical protein
MQYGGLGGRTFSETEPSQAYCMAQGPTSGLNCSDTLGAACRSAAISLDSGMHGTHPEAAPARLTLLVSSRGRAIPLASGRLNQATGKQGPRNGPAPVRLAYSPQPGSGRLPGCGVSSFVPAITNLPLNGYGR